MLQEDHEIVAQILEGQPEQFETLIKRYQQDAYHLALFMLRHPTDAEDAVSEAFVKAYQALSGWRREGSMKSWLLRITTNCCQDILRGRKKNAGFVEISQLELIDKDAEEPGDALICQEEKQKMLRALSQLEIEDRTAIILKYCHDVSYQEIAATFHWPMGTVASRLARARQKLRTLLEGGVGHEA